MVQGIICMTLHLHVLLHIQEMAKYTQEVDTYPGSETCITGIIEAFKIAGEEQELLGALKNLLFYTL